MRRDRDGELLELDLAEESARHACERGWLGEDWQGRPVPCLTCKPWLDPKRQQAHR